MDVARRNARSKAEAVAGLLTPATPLVLGVDTVVALGDLLLGKPAGESEAEGFLRALCGRTHRVVSGLCLVDRGHVQEASERTDVTFRELTDPEIAWYLRTGEWRERAGGYAIQGRGAALVRRIEGDYLNVVGLPVARLLALIPDLLVASEP